MLEKIEDLKYFLGEIMKMDFKNVTSEQRENLQREYNKGMSFKYNIDNLIFIMDEYTWKIFMYYLGMEYESDNIGMNLTYDDMVIVRYIECTERLEDLFETLGEIKSN